ncbi:hypothetical protein Tco_0998941 [Tanacetum coccineum]
MLGRKRAGKEQQQESLKKQRMKDDKETDEVEEVEEDDEAELKKHLVIVKDDEIAIDASTYLLPNHLRSVEVTLLKEGIMVILLFEVKTASGVEELNIKLRNYSAAREMLRPADKCVYSKFDETGKGVIICLYVDDMLIFGTYQVLVDLTKEFLSLKLSMKDIGEANVLKKFNYFDCTPVSTPMATSEKLIPNNGQAVSQLDSSRVIGCLMYVMTCTRPDIAFAVGKLSRYTSNYGTQHWQAIQQISNAEDTSSTSGWVFLLGGGAIFGLLRSRLASLVQQ